MKDLPTKEQFQAYEFTRQTGMFNMIMQAREAAEFSDLDLKTYFSVQENFGKLREKYPDVYGKQKGASNEES